MYGALCNEKHSNKNMNNNWKLIHQFFENLNVEIGDYDKLLNSFHNLLTIKQEESVF
jgi:hypothetical protein